MRGAGEPADVRTTVGGGEGRGASGSGGSGGSCNDDGGGGEAGGGDAATSCTASPQGEIGTAMIEGRIDRISRLSL